MEKELQVVEEGKQTTVKVVYGEDGLTKSNWGDFSENMDINPDNVTAATYLKMIEQDAQIASGISLFRLAIMSKPWDIKFSDEFKHPKRDEILKFIKNQYQNLGSDPDYPGTFEDFLREFMLAPALGFSVGEPVYWWNKKSKMVELKKLKCLPHESIKFKTDEYGNLEKIEQSFYSGGDINELKPLDKYLIWVHGMRGGNYYGTSILKSAYKHWYIKEFLLKIWNLYLERKATPVPVGKTHPSRMKDLKKYLDNLEAKSSLVLSTDDVVDVLRMDGSAAKEFMNAIKYHDTMMYRAMMTPTLLMGQEDVGARALGDTHLLVFMWVINSDKAAIVEHTYKINKTLVMANWGEMEEYPRLYIPDLSDIELKDFGDLMYKMVMVGVFNPQEEWIRKRFGAPTNPSMSKVPTTAMIPSMIGNSPGQQLGGTPIQPKVPPPQEAQKINRSNIFWELDREQREGIPQPLSDSKKKRLFT